MLLDDLIDLPHKANGLAQSGNDAVVVGDVGRGKGAALAVLEPLLADLIAADVEVPHGLGNTAEAFCLGFVCPDGFVEIRHLLDFRVLAADPFGDLLVKLRRFHQVEGDEFPAQFGQGAEKVKT